MDNKSPIKPKLVLTNDGSHTLYSNRFGQHYHNPNGAVAERKHIFFEQNGLMEALATRDQINILEIGFGTGLNLLMLMDEYLKHGSSSQINYHTIEAFPISPEKAISLNYGNYLQHPELAEKLPNLFSMVSKGFNHINIISGINCTIFNGFLKNYHPNELSFDFLFHDAFSPDVNPELWTGEVFQKLKEWSSSDAILSTYCAASKSRGAMAWAGWKVARATGALGKREMTVASPSTEPLAHLKRVNEERLAQRYEQNDFGKSA